MRCLSSRHDLGGSSNFQTRALKTIHVARLSPFARTRAFVVVVLGVRLADGCESPWRVGLTDGIESPTVILRVFRARAYAFRTRNMVNNAWQGHIFVVARSDTDVQIVRYIPLSSWFPPKFPSRLLELNIFFRCSECLKELAINVLFWTYSQT